MPNIYFSKCKIQKYMDDDSAEYELNIIWHNNGMDWTGSTQA